MALIDLQNLHLQFQGPPLFDGVDLSLQEGDRLCLVGRNGAGKSTLLRVMAGLLEPDEGTVVRRRGLRAAYLGQDLTVQGAAGKAGGAPGDKGPDLEEEKLLTQFGLTREKAVLARRGEEGLSGGERRRADLARVLASGAEVILLDEPTNHLDLDSVFFLEEYLRRQVKTLVFITHDRAFARSLANRTAEIDRGQLYSFSAGYDEFLRRREELLEAEQKRRAQFDKKLAEEEAWLRRGVKARRRRNEGRVKKLQAMRESCRQRREREGAARLEIREGRRSGDLIAEAEGLSFGYNPEQPLVRDFSAMIMRGDRVGIAGPNGAGKTTLVNLLLGEMEPWSGSVRRGVNLQILYFDQLRGELDPDRTVAENLGEGADTVTLNGGSRHILGYLQDFLFSPERARSPVAHLSGGEKNRLILAKLFARPSNLLVMDEPTNDLDVETLELLEERLQDYPGTVLLISHDREFLDNVVTECLILDGRGGVTAYAGGYSDWRAQAGTGRAGTGMAGTGRAGASGAGLDRADKTDKTETEAARRNRKRKLSFKENRELEELPDRIAALEEEKDEIHRALANPDLYREASASAPGGPNPDARETAPRPADPAALTARLEPLEEELEEAYRRWEELDRLEP